MRSLNFSTKAESEFLRWHPIRERYNKDYEIYRLFIEPISVDDKVKLLFRTKKESSFDYNIRSSLATWSPDSATAIEMITGSVFRNDIRREFKSTALEAWSNNVDRQHTHLDYFVREQTKLTLTYGSSYVLMNLPRRPGDFVANTLADEQPFLTPILRSFNPLNLLNWQVDDNGELLWVLFYNIEVKDQEWVHKWYLVDRTQYKEFYSADYEFDPQLLMQASHNFGFVPVVPCYYHMIEPMIGRSYIEQSADLDIKKFIQEADLEYDRFMQSHPFLILKSEEDYGTVEIDAQKYLRVNPGDDVSYVRLDAQSFEINQEAILQTRMDIARKLRIDPLGFVMQQGKIELSGVSRQLSFALHQADTLSSVADCAEVIDNNILKMAYKILEDEEPVDVTSSYEKDFSLSAIDTQISVYKEIGKDIPSEEFEAEMLSRFARALIGNNDGLNKRVEDEIRSNIGQLSDDEVAQIEREVNDAAQARDVQEDD